MQSFFDLIQGLEALLPDSTDTPTFLGHTPGSGGGPAETLAEHVRLVNRYFGRLSSAHGLEPTVDSLIRDLVAPLYTETERAEATQNHIKKLFVAALVFHDFGKINYNYQWQSLSNPKWKDVYQQVPFFPDKGHSELGAFLYVHYFFPYAWREKDARVKSLLLQLTFGLSYSISQHHAKGQFSLHDYGVRKMQEWYTPEWYGQMKPFLEFYNFGDTSPTQKVWLRMVRETKGLVERANPAPYVLHSLIKLNFSLLTASDYLATSDYMSGVPMTEFGTIGPELRAKIIRNARGSVNYNTEIFAAAADPNYRLQFPTERGNTQLNTLRKEMAVEALRTLEAYPNERIYYLEAPTGGGKTNISMLAAARLLEMDDSLNKLLYVFPFTTLATQTLGALKEVYGLEDHEVAEIHGKAAYQSVAVEKERTEVDADYGREREDHLRYLFFHFPIALVTHVRFFSWLTTHWKEPNYIYHRLAGSVVILDELQAYDPKHWAKVARYLDHLARHFNVRFIIMSATLPKLDALLPEEQRLAAAFRPLIPDARRYLTNPNFAARVNFNFSLLYDERGRRLTIDPDALRKRVLVEAERYRKGQNQVGIFVIVEFIFKRSAARFQQLFADGDYFDEIYLLSGTVLEPQRRLIINRLKREETRAKRVLLITTQVVEAGVDLDMDIGFKHVSLPDSDEQLAGRINRNVRKQGCRLFLFYSGDDPKIIYGEDYRYQRLAEIRKRDPWAHMNLHRSTLQDKAFGDLYARVFGFIGDLENMPVVNMATYEQHLRELDLVEAHQNFQLIEGKNETVFVPIQVPIAVLGGNADGVDPVFTDGELSFLRQLGVAIEDDLLDGAQVFEAYLRLVQPPEEGQPNTKRDFIREKTHYRRLAAILSRFTFSLMSTDKLQRKLVSFTDPDKSAYGYWYLHDLSVYSLEGGLDQDRFDIGIDNIQ